jgi:transcriptional regulator with GAF, ATPase, and Fis domain
MKSWNTQQDTGGYIGESAPPIPGVVIVFSGERPTLRALAAEEAGVILGHDLLGDDTTDDRISRQHARLRWVSGAFEITDLASRNGTFVAGMAVTGSIKVAPPAVVRTGHTLTLLVGDVRPYQDAAVDEADGAVVGPTLAASWRTIRRAAQSGNTLLLTGESGTGKELGARAFHAAAGGDPARFVAVNCAAIPEGVAERLLFGTRRGAYSGADRDAEGYLAAADGGTLFLDEIAELDLAVQAKLLRVLETGELLPLGAAHPQPVSVRVVAATLRDLRSAVVAEKFREDLYYRIGRPEVHLPPLRQRLEEIPWLIARQLGASALTAHASLVEACLLRPWPGNLRELLAETQRAGAAAQDANRTLVRATDLDERAGMSLGERGTAAPTAAPPAAQRKSTALPDRDAIQAALRAADGNVTAAARALGVHRNQLRRWLARNPE